MDSDAKQIAGSADGGAVEQPGGGIDGADAARSKSVPNGNAGADELARIRQEALNIGYGKAMAKAEKEWTAREAKLRQQMLSDLGLESDADITRYKEERMQADKQRPEHERRYRETELQMKQLQSRLVESEKTQGALAERWFNEYKGRLVSGIARQVNLHSDAEDDLDAFLDRSIVTPGGDAGDKLTFRDRGVEVDMSEADAMAKIAAHIQKHKPLWVRPTVGHGAGTAAVRPSNGNGRPLTPREMRDAFIADTVASMPLMKR